MARVVPSDYRRLAQAGCHEPELDTLDLLRRRLPADYTVFHSVDWTAERRGRIVFGEADFVVVNRAGEGLVIEQKNGPMKEGGGGLWKQYRDGSSSDPFFQVRRSVDAMKEKFPRQAGGGRLQLDYLVYLPDWRVGSVNAAGIDRSRLVDASADDDLLVRRIEEILGTGRKDAARRNRVENFFRQSFDIRPDVHAHVRKGEKNFVRLSGGLSEILTNIRMAPLRLRVNGAPGCGKTVVAQHFFEHAVAQGRKPLLVCFNRPLREKIAAACPKGGRVETWYGLCHRFLKSTGEEVDFSARQGDDEFWNKMQDRVVASPIGEEWQYDTVIVDEGQDFEPGWYDILGLFAREDADFVWLEDRDQGIRRNNSAGPAGFVGYDARANYRSPRSVARFIERALPFEFEPANGLPGLGVGVHSYEEREDQARIVAKTVVDLRRRGFDAADIVILSIRGIGSTGLSDRDRVGNFTLKKFTGEYDLLGNQCFTTGQIRLDSVYRFKGQQAPAVIVIDVESGGRDADRTNRLLYTAFSRAQVRLDVIAKSGDPLTDRLIPAAH